MQPLFCGGTAFFVHEFVLGHKKAGKERKPDVELEHRRGVGDEEQKQETEKDAQRIERMPDALPARKAAPAMEVKFVDPDQKSLQKKRGEKKR